MSLTEIYSRIEAEEVPPKPTGPKPRLEQNLEERLDDLRTKAQRGRKADARKEMLELAELFSQTSVAPAFLYEAALLEKADADNRIQELYRIVLNYPRSPWAVKTLREIGETHFLLQDFSGALDAFQAYSIAKGEGYDRHAFRLKTVYSLLQLRRYRDALNVLDRLDIESTSYRSVEKILDLKSECQIALGRFGEAVMTIRTLLRDYPNYALTPKALLSLALCYEELDRPEFALKIYRYIETRSSSPFESRIAGQRLAGMETPFFPQNKISQTPPSTGSEQQEKPPPKPEGESEVDRKYAKPTKIKPGAAGKSPDME